MVLGQLLTVPVNLGRGTGTVDLQEEFGSIGQVCLVNGLGIVSGAAIIVGIAVLAVDGIPGVGQVDEIPAVRNFGRNSSGFLGESPFPVQTDNLAHKSSSLLIVNIVIISLSP